MNIVLTIKPDLLDDTSEFHRVDNITDTVLRKFRVHYNDSTITKDAIFDYVYGILHGLDVQERFVSDLRKGLPRIPMASEFYAFADAGGTLAKLHLDYETCEEYPCKLKKFIPECFVKNSIESLSTRCDSLTKIRLH